MSKNKYAINDKFQSTADYRLQVIAPLLHLKPENKIQKTEYQNKLKGISSDTGVSVRTLKRWLKNYSEKGIAGLNTKYPKIRTDNKLYIKFESLLDEAKAMRLQSPTISVNEIIACLEGRYPDLSGILKRSTLQEHLSKNGYGRNDYSYLFHFANIWKKIKSCYASRVLQIFSACWSVSIFPTSTSVSRSGATP